MSEVYLGEISPQSLEIMAKKDEKITRLESKVKELEWKTEYELSRKLAKALGYEVNADKHKLMDDPNVLINYAPDKWKWVSFDDLLKELEALNESLQGMPEDVLNDALIYIHSRLSMSIMRPNDRDLGRHEVLELLIEFTKQSANR